MLKYQTDGVGKLLYHNTYTMKEIKIKLLKDDHVTDKNYYQDHMYMSNSMLKLFMDKCPRFFEHATANPLPTTKAMRFGSAFHMLVLEPNEFNNHYAVEPDGIDRRTTLGKTTLLKFNERLNGRESIAHKDYTLMQNMNTHLKANTHYPLLENCNQFEQIYLWKNETQGILCKGKLDAVNTTAKYIVDLKTTNNASPEVFKDIIIERKYHMQAAFYCDALGYNTYYIYAIEKSAPYCMCVFKLSKDMLKEGRRLYTEAISAYIAYNMDRSLTDYNNDKICEI